MISIEHALTLNEIAFDVALKLQHQNQNRHLSIDYLDNDNKIEFINDTKMKEQVLLDTYRIQLSQNVCRTQGWPDRGLWGLSQPPNLQKFRFFCSTKFGNFLTFVTEKKFTPLKNRKIQLSTPKHFAATPPMLIDSGQP